jgi:hypothetical protein
VYGFCIDETYYYYYYYYQFSSLSCQRSLPRPAFNFRARGQTIAAAAGGAIFGDFRRFVWGPPHKYLYSCMGPRHLSEMRGRPAGRFLGDMTTPRRPGESLVQFLVGIFFVKILLYGSSASHSPTIKIRAHAHAHKLIKYLDLRVTIIVLMFGFCYILLYLKYISVVDVVARRSTTIVRVHV